MSVLLISPGYPAEMPLFCRGLAEVGVPIIGIGDQPLEALPEPARRSLAHYVQAPSLWREEHTVQLAKEIADRTPIDQVECLWEPGILLAARIREALGLDGMKVAQAELFRDKEKMKLALDAAGIRTPRHARASTARECREAVERIGYPVIFKPIAGAGSADTYRVESDKELEDVLPKLRHVDEVSVEEFIQGEEYTFDTVSIEGAIAYSNVSWYRPPPLIARTVEWISPQTVALRDIGRKDLRSGVELGKKVLAALGYRSGFTHMEWFLCPDGEAIFGEIGARPPGARSVDIMNYVSDIDLFKGWAEAVTRGSFSQSLERLYNAIIIFKRARGSGRIRYIEGLERLLSHYGRSVVSIDLLPVGSTRRNWKQTLLSDGHMIIRDPDLQTAMHIADRVGTDLQIQAE
jgi:hypothetical protein